MSDARAGSVPPADQASEPSPLRMADHLPGASALLQAERPEAGEFLPHVVAWNLTKRCNLRCSHCYISAGPFETAESELCLLYTSPSPRDS